MIYAFTSMAALADYLAAQGSKLRTAELTGKKQELALREASAWEAAAYIVRGAKIGEAE